MIECNEADRELTIILLSIGTSETLRRNTTASSDGDFEMTNSDLVWICLYEFPASNKQKRLTEFHLHKPRKLT